MEQFSTKTANMQTSSSTTHYQMPLGSSSPFEEPLPGSVNSKRKPRAKKPILSSTSDDFDHSMEGVFEFQPPPVSYTHTKIKNHDMKGI